MRTCILILLLAATNCTWGQGVINAQAGSGVPTDMATGGLLGALLAPMVSKGPDAKLVGALLGAMAGGAYGTAQRQQQQQWQQQLAAHESWAQQQWQWQQQHQWQQQQLLMHQLQQQQQQPMTGMRQGEYVQSPFSKYRFHMASQGIQSGDTLYDPQTGRPFRVP